MHDSPAPRSLARFDPTSWLCMTFAIFVFVYGICATALFAGQRWLLFPTYAVLPAERFHVGPDVRKISIQTDDGETIWGLWKPPAPGMPTVLSFHGNADTPYLTASRFSQGSWRQDGWGILAVTYRGYPGSTGSVSEAGLMQDGEAAYNFVREAAPTSRIVIHGYSLGTGVALSVAAHHDIASVLLEAPYTSIRDVVREVMPAMPSGLVWYGFRSDLAIPSVRAPIYIVHGTADTVIPYDLGVRLAGMGKDVHLRLAPGLTHWSVFGSADATLEPILVSGAR